MKVLTCLIMATFCPQFGFCRDEEKISKACYWPHEVYEPCFGGCAEVSCDNPRSHLRPCYPYCEAGCVCEEPYVRDDRTHQCVLPQDCSPTQMGIPVITKRNAKQPPSKYDHQVSRNDHNKRPDLPEFVEHEPSALKHADDYRTDMTRTSEISRMGNYFNIVIAPPPIKALQPRKLLHSEAALFRSRKRL